ncbi:MAG: penicillin-binding protein 1A, partial [Gammaproteobacteria bacterium]
AFLAAEDDRFFQHPGVDWQGIVRAGLHLLTTGEKTQGGSTITMQVARNFFLSREKTYQRKLNEILLALKIERELSKQAIFELYLNKIYFGHRAYGVSAAAQVYYGAELEQLDLAQTAMITGLPKAPSVLNPITSPSRALERRNYVLRRMHTLGYIDDGELELALAEADSARLHGPTVEVPAPYVAEMVRNFMIERYGEDAYGAGYRVVTTIDGALQRVANEALGTGLLAYDRRHGYRGPEHRFDYVDDEPKAWTVLLEDFRPAGGLLPALVTHVGDQFIQVYTQTNGKLRIPWEGLRWARRFIDADSRGPVPTRASDILKRGDLVRVYQPKDSTWQLSAIPEVEGSLVALSPKDGAILALTGGFDFQLSKFNRATQATRQPGSSFKPFIYSAALATGYTPASIIVDEPLVFTAVDGQEPWRPENYSGDFYGPTRLRDALAHSRNIVSIRLLQGTGIDRAIAHLTRFGFERERLPRVLSLALGSASFTPLEMIGAYAVLANGGFRVEPYFIDRILAADGRIVWQADRPKACWVCEQQTSHVRPVAYSEGSGASVQKAAVVADEAPRAPRVIDSQNAWMMYSMLQDVIRYGTAKAASVLNRGDLAGKTGTTDDLKDAWFSGFNNGIAATAWVGYDDNQPLGRGETGAKAALPVWIDFMRVALKDRPEAVLPQPSGLVTVRIDPATGLLAEYGKPAIFETFRDGEEPARYSRPEDLEIEGGLSEGDGSSSITEQLF